MCLTKLLTSNNEMKTLQSNHVPPRTNNLVWLRGNAASSGWGGGGSTVGKEVSTYSYVLCTRYSISRLGVGVWGSTLQNSTVQYSTAQYRTLWLRLRLQLSLCHLSDAWIFRCVAVVKEIQPHPMLIALVSTYEVLSTDFSHFQLNSQHVSHFLYFPYFP